MSSETKPLPNTIDVKDLYKVLLDTRNLEISLFWQRSNYFLVLNSGIAFGFFTQANSTYGFLLAIFGLLASMLWFWVCLGSKFWQARWEQRILEFEKEHLPDIDFFGASPHRIQRDVVRSLTFHRLGCVQRSIYRLVLKKPSVSYSMIRLSAIFVLAWAAFISTFLLVGKNPFL